ncbi:GFA family protein [Baekduia soli]|uniref:GFA family protein n=1 Tax=Baekduia soli TaxID=496014 RepID=A0A5B8U0E8_9ACTN|nr:GFA family protein [Baekduia soli]QEC46457.1 GFA family protein [Baekduia soli]
MSDDAIPAPSLPLTGGCGCGAVRFEIDEPLVGAAYCHCTRCQHRSGTGFQASARAAPGSVRLTAGEEHLRAWSPGGLDKVFCALCGSAVLARQAGSGEIEIVRMAAIDGDPGIRPSARQFTAYAAPWEPIPDDGLPRHPERLPA